MHACHHRNLLRTFTHTVCTNRQATGRARQLHEVAKVSMTVGKPAEAVESVPRCKEPTPFFLG